MEETTTPISDIMLLIKKARRWGCALRKFPEAYIATRRIF